jgi:hypothetical protein
MGCSEQPDRLMVAAPSLDSSLLAFLDRYPAMNIPIRLIRMNLLGDSPRQPPRMKRSSSTTKRGRRSASEGLH